VIASSGPDQFNVSRKELAPAVYGVLVILTWVLPVLNNSGVLPREYQLVNVRLAKITHLFTRRLDDWSWFEIQARLTGGGGQWVTLRLSDYSGMQNYGYLTRLDRILDEAGSRERGPRVRRDLARWLASAHARRFPESPTIRELRFLRVSAPVGAELLAQPSGHWVRPALEAVPVEWVREIAIVTDQEWNPRASSPGAR
jgi:hypothetical protein